MLALRNRGTGTGTQAATAGLPGRALPCRSWLRRASALEAWIFVSSETTVQAAAFPGC